MRLTKIPFAEAKAFSSFFLDYIQQKPSLTPFYEHFPQLENFNKSLTKKQAAFPLQHRRTLVEVLQHQYASLQPPDSVSANILALERDKTFTVTTGHQLNVFTGPLYFIYKIVTVINTCRRLKELFPDYHFVPVYWMASEDHDYDEIKSFRLYGKKYTWETKQSGAVGRFHTKDFKNILDQIPGDVSVFRTAYTKNDTLSAAVRHYVNDLFGNEGLVVIDADDPKLKQEFKGVIRADVLQQEIVGLVNPTNTALEKLGYKTQIFCRDINFFYLDHGLRGRIEKQDNDYAVVDTDLRFSPAEIEQMIEHNPEKFSPNVILRPLYQEMILPNLAYVGGPAEVIYWLQLKSVFDRFHVPFPILLPRNFGLIIEQHIERKWLKTGLPLTEIFEDKNYLHNEWTLQNSAHNLTVAAEQKILEQVFHTLRERAGTIDATLAPFLSAETKRVMKSLEKIEYKMLRAEKRLHSDKLRQITEVKDALFPNGSLQERTDNFLNFYQRDKQFISKLMQHFDPFDFSFHILTYTE